MFIYRRIKYEKMSISSQTMWLLRSYNGILITNRGHRKEIRKKMCLSWSLYSVLKKRHFMKATRVWRLLTVGKLPRYSSRTISMFYPAELGVNVLIYRTKRQQIKDTNIYNSESYRYVLLTLFPISNVFNKNIFYWNNNSFK